MIRDNWADLFSFDRHCVFSYVKLNGKWENHSIINRSLMQPACETIDVLGAAAGYKPSYVSTKYDMTRLANSDASFLFYVKLDDERLSKLKYSKIQCKNSSYLPEQPAFDVIHLLKQGTTNVNGVIDIYIEACRCTDGVFRRLVVKQHLSRTCRFNVVKAKVVLPEISNERPYDKIFIDINNSLHTVSVDFNGETILSDIIDPALSVGLLYNHPMSDKIECHRVAIGDEFEGFDIACAMLFDKNVPARIARDIEKTLDVKLNKIDSTALQ